MAEFHHHGFSKFSPHRGQFFTLIEVPSPYALIVSIVKPYFESYWLSVDDDIVKGGQVDPKCPDRCGPDPPYLFFWTNPRPHSPHPVVEGVDFIETPPRNEEWSAGPIESHVLARSRRQPTKFKAFKSELDVPMGWEILDGPAEVWSTWEAFERHSK